MRPHAERIPGQQGLHDCREGVILNVLLHLLRRGCASMRLLTHDWMPVATSALHPYKIGEKIPVENTTLKPNHERHGAMQAA